jgi:hypothetical protein
MTWGRRLTYGLALCGSLVLASTAFSASQPLRDSTPDVRSSMASSTDVADAPSPSFHFAKSFDVHTFRRGNIHTHTRRSDGDSSPRAVYSWYRDHGYDFVIVTDHNRFTDPDEFRSVETPGFIVIGGEEITMRGAGREVHVNALCTHRRLPGGKFASAAAALAHGVNETRHAGAIALVNHPNFTWGVQFSDLPAAATANLIEIESGHPSVHTEGDDSHPSHEGLWDETLTAGIDFMGVAVDDAHNFKGGPAGPGRAWVEVFADQLDESSICGGLQNGMLYASTGASLERIAVGDGTYTVWPADEGAEVTFIGASGRELAHVVRGADEHAVAYRLTGGEGYVRARIVNPSGKLAFTPPVRVTEAQAIPVANVTASEPVPPG